jgi:hypothetical protein
MRRDAVRLRHHIDLFHASDRCASACSHRTTAKGIQ